MEELLEILNEAGLIVTVEELAGSESLRANINDVIESELDTLRDQTIEEGVDYVLSDVLPAMQRYFRARQFLYSMEEPGFAEKGEVTVVLDAEASKMVYQELLELPDLMTDYAMWVGHNVTSPEPSPPDHLTPFIYIQEFFHSAWMPPREHCEKFLSNFQTYSQQSIKDLLDEFSWD